LDEGEDDEGDEFNGDDSALFLNGIEMREIRDSPDEKGK
jgi:hypothetical protein